MQQLDEKSSLSTSGQQGTCFITIRKMISDHLLRKCPELLQFSRTFQLTAECYYQTSGRNCLQRIKKNMKKWQGIIREWPSKYPNQVSNAPPFYVLDNIFNPSEWPLQQSEVISYVTFRCNFTELVVSEAMSSWHLQVKMELHRWQCHCFMYIICLQGLTSLC